MAVVGLLPHGIVATSGSITLAGREVLGRDAAARRRLLRDSFGVVFQNPDVSLNPRLTIWQQLREALPPAVRRSRTRSYTRSLELLDHVGVGRAADRLRAFPHELSGGLNQRIVIAIAIARSPQMLIADEPTTALDVSVQKQVLDLIDGLRRELDLGVILVSHDIGVIADRADEVLVLKRRRRGRGRADRCAVLGRAAARVHARLARRGAARSTARTRRGAGTAALVLMPGCAEFSVRGVRQPLRALDARRRRAAARARRSASSASQARARRRWRASWSASTTATGRADRVRRAGPGRSRTPRRRAAARRAVRLPGSVLGRSIRARGGRRSSPSRSSSAAAPSSRRASARRSSSCWTTYACRAASRAAGRSSCPAASASVSSSPARWRSARKVLVADEPVSALDLSVQAAILGLLARLRAERDLTYLVISHDLAVIKQLCTDVVVMRERRDRRTRHHRRNLREPRPRVHARTARRHPGG